MRRYLPTPRHANVSHPINKRQYPPIRFSAFPCHQFPYPINFVISSSSSCRSSSEILSCRLGTSVFASSAVSQHREPILHNKPIYPIHSHALPNQYQLIPLLSSLLHFSFESHFICFVFLVGGREYEPSCARSNFASSLCADSSRSTASTFSFRLKRAKWSR